MKCPFCLFTHFYRSWVKTELQNITAQPSSAKQIAKTTNAPRVLIDQNDLYVNIFSNITDSGHVGKILMLYITSLAKHNIAAQQDISKIITIDLVQRKQFETLQSLMKYSLINESKGLACILLSKSHEHPSVKQMTFDMLHKLNAETVNTKCNENCPRLDKKTQPTNIHTLSLHMTFSLL